MFDISKLKYNHNNKTQIFDLLNINNNKKVIDNLFNKIYHYYSMRLMDLTIKHRTNILCIIKPAINVIIMTKMFPLFFWNHY